MKKLSNTEAELKKSVAYKETCIGLDLAGVQQKKGFVSELDFWKHLRQSSMKRSMKTFIRAPFNGNLSVGLEKL